MAQSGVVGRRWGRDDWPVVRDAVVAFLSRKTFVGSAAIIPAHGRHLRIAVSCVLPKYLLWLSLFGHVCCNALPFIMFVRCPDGVAARKAHVERHTRSLSGYSSAVLAPYHTAVVVSCARCAVRCAVRCAPFEA
ncbi:uncharacterized protein SPSK_10663 [Sporothrix schenckii 1099-18]|uniref:Uncharacterized protein n=1 Tax=Sporothrix schenckii 1099-18 TaxID=1397361 RepID=A0A0F2LVM2_SPOSC|nr:uncharacterized protein SPSK_10663 [Sporothrix schenckii 1099-18]KJR80909.1 hypothetical protein SPSK_10663 [Sporothrix schenckii 1099-18]